MWYDVDSMTVLHGTFIIPGIEVDHMTPPVIERSLRMRKQQTNADLLQEAERFVEEAGWAEFITLLEPWKKETANFSHGPEHRFERTLRIYEAFPSLKITVIEERLPNAMFTDHPFEAFHKKGFPRIEGWRRLMFTGGGQAYGRRLDTLEVILR